MRQLTNTERAYAKQLGACGARQQCGDVQCLRKPQAGYQVGNCSYAGLILEAGLEGVYRRKWRIFMVK